MAVLLRWLWLCSLCLCSTVVTHYLSRMQNSGDCLLNRAGAIIR